MNDFDDDENPTKFRGIDVRGGKKGIDAANNYIATLTAGALKYMEKRFQVSSDIIKDLEIFDPTTWPTTASNRTELSSFGNEELDRILQHFNPLITNDLQETVKEQWLRLKFYVCKRIPLSERHGYSLWPRIYTTDKRFSAIMKVISFVSLIPMNTAACERGFSSMNRIKSKGRSGISNDMLNSLMRISLDGLELEKFDPQPAVTYCSKKKKNRRPGFRKTSKSTIDCDTGHTHTPTLSDD